MPAVRANILRSSSVAVTGIAAPIALSFVLKPMTGASYLECFAAGAALCSTSLGTTFTVLRACGLSTTRVGVVLTSAAMLDDVVGLVMVQVIANLGTAGEGNFDAVTIVRPVLVSIAFAVVAVVVCRFVVQPVRGVVKRAGWAQPGTRVGDVLFLKQTKLVMLTALLVGLVTGSSYAGTSNLFAAYIAGAVLSWWDSFAPSTSAADNQVSTPAASTPAAPSQTSSSSTSPASPHFTSAAIFEQYYHPALYWILTPYFFASIGFSIPITQMFSGTIVWKGVVYGVLMGLAKLVCGVWLLRMPSVGDWFTFTTLKIKVKAKLKAMKLDKVNEAVDTPTNENENNGKDATATSGVVDTDATGTGTDSPSPVSASPPPEAADTAEAEPDNTPHAAPAGKEPFSLYPAAILGLAMVPRGEIGFLISAVASSTGVFEPKDDSTSPLSDVFLIVTWAIVLCTVVGPLSVGLLVRRVKRLSAGQDNISRNPLGVWGVQ